MEANLTLGYTMALGCALVWSISLILFKQTSDEIHPVLLNITKNTIGLILFIPTLWILEGQLWFSITNNDLLILCISGFLGIGIADFLILRALSLMGASRLAIVECLYSPFIIVLSVIFLGESFTLARGIGTAFVIAAIVSVTYRRAKVPQPENDGVLSGTIWGAVGLLVMAVGIVMMKPLFHTVPLMWMITIRLAAGVIASFAVYLFTPQRKIHLQKAFKMRAKYRVVFASFLSTYVAMLMWVAGFKYNDVMVAAVLNQTSTIFTVLLAVVFLREQLTIQRTIGALLAFAGVVIMAV